MGKPRSGGALAQLLALATTPEHLKAFAFMLLMITSGFLVIPYIALYMTTNVDMPESQIPLIYLCGGVATLFSARLIGKWADKVGKIKVFQWLALATFVPMLITTHLVPIPLWLVLLNSTAFFVLVSGRAIPGMALISASAAPQVRGSFMSLASAVQMVSSGLASLIGGMIIERTQDGRILHYDLVGYAAVACGVGSIWLVRRLCVNESSPLPATAQQKAADPAA
jgi:predicted MFS family arabinose efflux permease